MGVGLLTLYISEVVVVGRGLQLLFLEKFVESWMCLNWPIAQKMQPLD